MSRGEASPFDLYSAAREEMIHEGFAPDFPPAVGAQVAKLKARPDPPAAPGVRDLRSLLWSSIDNDTSRDLDQVEVAERVPAGIRILIAVADVDSAVPAGSPMDQHAASETTSVYTGVRTFPMLPEEVSTDLTSLNESEDRLAVVIDMVVDGEGSVASASIYRALVRNRAQLTYNAIGPWLSGLSGPPPKVAASADLLMQLKMQDEAARLLREERRRLGALNMDRAEAEAVIRDGAVVGIKVRQKNRATELIENFMVAANGAMARTLFDAGVSSIRRVVRTPQRWPRIVELASRYQETLPDDPDVRALNGFLQKMKVKAAAQYADISLAVVKLLGPGEYVLSRPGERGERHFALSANDYTHSTAPNRRFADTVTQRLIKAVLWKTASPYSDAELDAIARNCTLKEGAARKVERVMNKRIAAVALHSRIGETFAGVVTGVTPKGVFVRIVNPPAEGLLVRGQEGVDVGDSLRVRLLDADPRRGYIDFAHAEA